VNSPPRTRSPTPLFVRECQLVEEDTDETREELEAVWAQIRGAGVELRDPNRRQVAEYILHIEDETAWFPLGRLSSDGASGEVSHPSDMALCPWSSRGPPARASLGAIHRAMTSGAAPHHPDAGVAAPRRGAGEPAFGAGKCLLPVGSAHVGE
jgi:hypothetical protein